MSTILVVQGEHPHDPFYPLELFQSLDGALTRAVELTKDFLTEWWEIHMEDSDEVMPSVTIENWSELVEKYGDEDDAVQHDGFGRWWVDMQEMEVKP